jgi:TonB family protein
MIHQPMPQSEPYGRTPPGDRKSAGSVGEKFSASEVTDVFRTLAAHGGAAASVDLALDMVLNEVLEQARLATGATGAAIGLMRDGEMVCRATTGADAPDLGVRFETTTGLSGACLQTGKVQQCDDTETDPRVNADACRTLGVRSMLVLPLTETNDAFGILEVFSSRPNAFSERDVRILQVVARSIVESKRGADVAAGLPVARDKAYASSHEMNLSPVDEPLPNRDSISLDEENSWRRSQLWTYVLGVLVILAAVLLGLALGWRGGAGRGASAERQKQASDPPAKRADQGADSATGAEGTSAAGSHPRVSSAASSTSSLQSSGQSGMKSGAPSGGLLVTQDGKVIYRLPSGEEPSAPKSRAAPEESRDTSATRLIHRVEPRYPADASAQRIEGSVVLDIQIGEDGAVHDIAIVSGNSELAEAAVEAVRQWRYRPYSVNGRRVEMQTRITIRFKLPPT